MDKTIIIKVTTEEALTATAGLITDSLSEADGDFHFAVSGGGTAILLFEKLRKFRISRKDIKKLHLWWVDERCVPPEDDQSNYGQALTSLIRPLRIPGENIHRMRGEAVPAEEKARYADELQTMLSGRDSRPVFDLIFLGMGEDGHTASVFPGNEGIFAESGAVATATHPQSGQERITLTPACINAAKRVFFLITGSGKAETLENVFYNKEEPLLPAARIRPESGELVWIIDGEAAARLE